MRRPVAGGRPRCSSHRVAPRESLQRRRRIGRWRWMPSLVLRILRDRPRDAGPWGEPAFAREVETIRRPAGTDPRPSRTGLVLRPRGIPDALSRRRPRAAVDATDGHRLRRALAGARRRRAAAQRGQVSSPDAPDASEEPRPLSFADAPLPACSSRPCVTIRPMPRWRRTVSSSGRATSASSDRGSTRCCRSASASATVSSKSSAKSRTRSVARRSRCRSSILPTSGGRAAGTRRSALSWADSRTATAGTWFWR